MEPERTDEDAVNQQALVAGEQRQPLHEDADNLDTGVQPRVVNQRNEAGKDVGLDVVVQRLGAEDAAALVQRVDKLDGGGLHDAVRDARSVLQLGQDEGAHEPLGERDDGGHLGKRLGVQGGAPADELGDDDEATQAKVRGRYRVAGHLVAHVHNHLVSENRSTTQTGDTDWCQKGLHWG